MNTNLLDNIKLTLTDSEWISLIDGNSNGSQLPVCCANVSALRDVFVRIVRNGRNNGIFVWDLDELKQKLKWFTDGHDIEAFPTIHLKQNINRNGIMWNNNYFT